MRVLVLILIVFSMAECTEKDYVIQGLGKNNKDMRLYIFPHDLSYNGVNDPIIGNGVVLTDDKIIREIGNEWSFEYSINDGKVFYRCQLMQNGAEIRSFGFNKDLEKVYTGHGTFLFDQHQLEKINDSFQQLGRVNIRVKSKADLLKLIELIKQIGGIVPVTGVDNVFFWEKYDGEILLKRNELLVPEEENFNDVLISELGGEDIGLISSINRFNTSDSLIIKVFVKSDFSAPEGWVVERKFEPFTDLTITIFDISKNDVKNLANANSLEFEFTERK